MRRHLSDVRRPFLRMSSASAAAPTAVAGNSSSEKEEEEEDEASLASPRMSVVSAGGAAFSSDVGDAAYSVPTRDGTSSKAGVSLLMAT